MHSTCLTLTLQTKTIAIRCASLTRSFCHFLQVSRYVSYRDPSIAIRIVSWGYRIVTTLLTTVELGDRAPSQLLREMQRLLGESAQQIDQALIRELFLQRLPPSIRMILASTGPDISLDAQATLADKMMEVSPALHQVHSIEQGQRRSERPERQSDQYPDRKPEQSLKCDMRDLKWQMEELTQKVDQLMNSRSRPESRSANPAPRPRQRSQSGNRPEGTRYSFRNDTCYYHFKFGDKATRCVGPCKMSAGNDQARH